MQPVEQTKINNPEAGIRGNCFAACLASLMEIHITAVPQFEEYMGDPVVWSMAANWLGYYRQTILQLPNPPVGYSMAVGPTNRWNVDRPEQHCCIVYNGEIIHDPHVSKDGLVKIDYYLTLDTVDPNKD